MIASEMIQSTKGFRNVNWEIVFVDAISNMDLDVLEGLIYGQVIISGQSKWAFLLEIENRFNYLKQFGAEQLVFSKQTCKMCVYGCPILFFQGSKRGSGIGFYLKYREGMLHDVQVCNYSTGNDTF